MDEELRRRLADRAFLFDDPTAYLAGVDAALRAVRDDHRASESDDTQSREPAARVLP